MSIRKFAGSLISAVVSIVMILSLATPALAQGVIIKGEPDGQNKVTVMDEHFYSGALEPSFTSENVSVATDSFGMHFTGAYHYGSALVLCAYKPESYSRFTFSIDMLQSNDGFIYCGFGGADEKTTVSGYDFNLSIARGVVAMYEMGGMDSWKSLGNHALSDALVAGKTTDFAVTLEKVSGNDFRVTFEILEEGKPIFTTDFGTTVRMSHPNGHFCMWGGMNEVFNIRDFKVYDSPDNVAFSDNFENSSLTYGDEPAGDSFWHINEARFTRSEVFIARSAGPEFKKAGDVITSAMPLVSESRVSKPYELSFKTHIKELSENAVYGLYLGAESAGDLSTATIIGVSAYDDRSAAVNIIKNGSPADAGDNLIPNSALNIDDTAVGFDITINGDNTLDVVIGEIRFGFSGVRYDGYWGICNYSLDGASAADARLDEVKLIQNTYTDCAEPDLSNDFGGIKLTPDGFEEYYISDRTYYMGPGVSLRPKGAFTPEPSLYFENAGSYSSFGPKQPYTDFILQFDLRMVSEGKNSQWFGVNFGKESYASIPDLYSSIYFEYYAWGTDPCTQMSTNLCSFEDGSKAQILDGYHFYKDQETKYNFMFVAKNRTVYVYFKEESEDISQLGICRAVIPDVNTAGFVSIFGVTGLSFDIFNYKLTNIAPEATGDSAIALRESFGSETISDKLLTEGTTQLQDGAMHLSKGSLSTKAENRYYIANFTLLGAGSDLTVSFADNKTLTLSEDLRTVTVNDGGKTAEFDVSEYGLSEYGQMNLQMILQYDGLSLSAKGIYEPGDKFATPIVEYTFEQPVEKGVLKWTSDDAAIDDVQVYSLDDTYKAEAVSYEQDPNDTDFWQEKAERTAAAPVEVEETRSLPTLFIVMYSVIGAVILALLGVIIAMSLKKRGNKK